MGTDQQPEGVDRKKRVQRLKKMIILSIVIGITVPWVACVALGIGILDLKREMRELESQISNLATALSAQDSGNRALREELEGKLSDERSANEELAGRIEALEAAAMQSKEQEEVKEEPEEPKVTHKVYLTFDDGPSIYTNEILDILKKYDVKATFFVLGKESEDAKQAIQRIVSEGHALGMHSYTHQYDQIYASKEAFAEDYQRIRDYLFQVTGVDCHLYRFPGGSSNAVSNVDVHEFIEYLKEQNTVYYDWNVSSGDAAKVSLSVEAILENATMGIEKQSVSVILFHDMASHRSTVDALPLVIEKILGMEDTQILPISLDDEPIQHVKSQD